jgi:signal transduction histidine kinase
VISRALETVGPTISDAQQQLQLQAPPRPLRVIADVRRLVQVFVNLLANASKFTPKGGRIELALGEDATRSNAVVRIADNGTGIAPEMLPSIFEIFVQSRTEEGRSRGGLGIGLNVVRKLVELHGGKVTAASPGIGQGSTFSVELPLTRA